MQSSQWEVVGEAPAKGQSANQWEVVGEADAPKAEPVKPSVSAQAESDLVPDQRTIYKQTPTEEANRALEGTGIRVSPPAPPQPDMKEVGLLTGREYTPSGAMPSSFEGHPENLAGYVEEGPLKTVKNIGKMASSGITPQGVADPGRLLEGASGAMEGAGVTLLPTVPFTAAGAPLATAAYGAAGLGLGTAAEAGTKALGAPPELQRFSRNLGYFVPSLFGMARAGFSGSPEATPAPQPGLPIDQLGITPTAAQAAAVDQVADAMGAAARAQASEGAANAAVTAPPPQPEPPPPADLFKAENLAEVGKAISEAPPQQRAQLLLEAQTNIAKQLAQAGKAVGPDGEVVVIKTPAEAEKIAADWVNEHVGKAVMDSLLSKAEPGGKATTVTSQQPKTDAGGGRQAAPEQPGKPAKTIEQEPPAEPPSEEELTRQNLEDLAARSAGTREVGDWEVLGEQEAPKGTAAVPPGTEEKKPEAEKPKVAKGDRVNFTDLDGTPNVGTVLYANDLAVRIRDENGRKVTIAPSKVSGVVAEDEMEAARRGAPSEPKPEAVTNEVPPEKRATTQIAAEENRKAAERVEGRTEAKKALEQPKYQYGNTQASVPEGSEAAGALTAARDQIPAADLAGQGKDIGGNHVTVRYGIQGDDTEGIKKFLEQQAPFEASLGKTEKFEPSKSSDGAAVIQAPVEAPELHRINAELEKHGDFIEPTFKEYKPHATVAYVKPEAADKYVGMDVTHGKKFTVNSIAISKRDGTQEVVKLRGKAEPFALTPPPADIGVQHYINSLPAHHASYARAFWKELESGGEDSAYEKVDYKTFGIPEEEADDIEDIDARLIGIHKKAVAPEQPAASNKANASQSHAVTSGGRPLSHPESAGGGQLAPAESEAGKATGKEQPAGERTESGSGKRAAEPATERERGPESGPGAGTGNERPAAAAAVVKRQNTDWYSHPDNFTVDAGPSKRLDWNLKALKLVKELSQNPRPLTDEERDALAHYVGWGALANIFAPWRAPYDERRKWEAAHTELESLLTPDQITDAQRSTQNAHYTSPDVVRFMWELAKRLGFKGGTVLEPSMGVGNFFGSMPKSIRANSTVIGNELDPATYQIAKLLYPGAKLYNQDFKDLILPDDSIDLAIGNVPFGNFNVFDPRYAKIKALIHDYFFIKTLDKVRPGGVAMYITSTGTLDKGNDAVRQVLADKADLLFALRLPSSTFDKSAGTSVTTDLLVFQKRALGQQPAGEKFLRTVKVTAPVEGTDEQREADLNEYFSDHPENLLGKLVLSKRMNVSYRLSLTSEGDVKKQLEEALKRAPRGVFNDVKSPVPNAAETEANFASDALLEGQFTITEKGDVRQRLNGRLVEPEAIKEKDGKISLSKKLRVKGMIGLRDATNELMAAMRTYPDDKEGNQSIAVLQKKLAGLYDKFVKSYGLLHASVNHKVFEEDPHYPRLLALEHYDRATKKAQRAEIFTKRTLYPRQPLRVVSPDPKEALYQVLAEKGNPDVDLLAELSGKSAEEIEAALIKDNLIFRDPVTGKWETREKYLSGYVRDKLRNAQSAVRQGHKQYARNVEALQKVIPETIPIKDIEVRFGATWIPATAIEQFVREVLNGGYRIVVTNTMGTWRVEGVAPTAEVTAEYGNHEFNADKLMEMALNQKFPTSYDKDADGKSTVNQQRTIAAKALQKKLQDKFNDWIHGHKDLGPQLEGIYNNLYNNLVLPEYDGSHLTFPGMSPKVTLKPHQLNAVWRLIQDGRGLLAHVVGAGKTFEMIAATMEMRRLGQSKKVLIAVPNHLVGQWQKEFLTLYPGANVLVPTKQDFEPVNRNRLMAKIATNDWDAVIVAHSQFNMMDISPERQMKTIRAQMDELEETIRAAEEAESSGNSYGRKKSKSRTVKQLENAKEKLRTRLGELQNLKADKTINFDDTGIDTLFVDEAHEYKNLAFYTKMTRIAGLGQGDAKRALRLKMKTDYLLEKNNNRGVIFATGTPVQNTMAELNTMIKYIAPDVLEKAGIRFFDDWAANFGSVITAMELSADARSYKARSKFARFTNVPELMQMFRSFSDVKTKEDLNLPIPKLEGGKPIMVQVPSNEIIEPLMEQLIHRAKAIRGEEGSRPDPKVDNMLKVTGDGRKVATDARLINPDYPDHPESKINHVVDKLVEEWKDGKASRTTMLVFLDNYQFTTQDENGKDKVLLNLYHDMRDKLVRAGVPRPEIAIIHDYQKPEQKQTLFDQVNEGKVRILFGSTQKMGAGMNVQRKLKALMHVDLPWKPGELEQREGRLLRQGNENEEVRIYYFLTKKSFDAYMAQTLQGKAEFINQVMSGKYQGRTMVDAASDMVLSLEEMKAIASGNPDVKRKIELEADQARLLSLKRTHEAAIEERKGKAERTRDQIGRNHGEIAAIQKTIASIQQARGPKGEGFALKLLGKEFTKHEDATEFLKTADVPPYNFEMTLNGVNMFVTTFTNMGRPTLEYRLPYSNYAFSAPDRSMLSLLASLEARFRALPDRVHDLEQANIKLEGEAAKLDVLATQTAFPDQKELDGVEHELTAVNKRLGIGNEGKLAEEQEVAADVDSSGDDGAVEDDDYGRAQRAVTAAKGHSPKPVAEQAEDVEAAFDDAVEAGATTAEEIADHVLEVTNEPEGEVEEAGGGVSEEPAGPAKEGTAAGVDEDAAGEGAAGLDEEVSFGLTVPLPVAEIKALWNADIQPKLEQLGVGLGDTAKLFISALYPRIEESSAVGRATGTGVNTEVMDAFMKLKGDRDKAMFMLEQLGAGIKKFFDRLPEADRIAFLDRYKTGKPQATRELDNLAAFYKRMDDAMYNEIQQSKPSLTYLDNHFRLFWEVIPGSKGHKKGSRFFSRRPLEGTRGMLKKHTLATASEGLQKGGKLVSTNPQTLFELGQMDALKFVTAQKFWKALEDLGMRKFVKPGDQRPEGFVQISDRIAKVYLRGEFTYPSGTTGERSVPTGEWYVDENAGRVLNNFLSRDLIRETSLGRGVLWLKNMSTAFELALSPFHAVFETIEAIGSQFGLGMMKGYNLGIRQGDPHALLEGIIDALTSPVSPATMASLGGKMISYARQQAKQGTQNLPQPKANAAIQKLKDWRELRDQARAQKFLRQYPDAQQLLDDLFGGGAQLDMNRDYAVNSVKTVREAWTSGNPFGAFLRVFPAAGHAVMAPLFRVYIPRLKVGFFLKQYAEQLAESHDKIASGDLTRAQVARKVWFSVENRFGEMNFDNLFWNRTLKTTLQLMFRSVTWKGGNLGLAVGATSGQIRDVMEWLHDIPNGGGGAGSGGSGGGGGVGGPTIGERALPKLDINMAWLLGVLFTTAALGTIIAYLSTGHGPLYWAEQDAENKWDLMKRLYTETVHPRSGDFDFRDKPIRWSLPTYWRDYEHAASNPRHYVVGSFSTLLGRTIDTIENKDFGGNYVYNPLDPTFKQAMEVSRYVFPKPFSFQNYMQAKEGGAHRAGIASGFGFTRAPYDTDFSPAEKRMTAIMDARHTPSTPEQREQFRADRDALESGESTARQRKQATRNLNTPFIVKLFKQMHYDEALDVYRNYATAEEQGLLRPVLERKRAALRARNPERLQKTEAAAEEQ